MKTWADTKMLDDQESMRKIGNTITALDDPAESDDPLEYIHCITGKLTDDKHESSSVFC